MALNLYEELTVGIRSALQGMSGAYKIKEVLNDDKIKDFDVIINGHAYFHMEDVSKGPIRLRYIAKPREYPPYSMNIQNFNYIHLFYKHNKLELSEVSQIIKHCFTFPETIDEDKKCISELAYSILGIKVPVSIIEYDLRTKSYFLVDWENEEGVENYYWRELFKTEKNEELILAKYMTFDTFIKTVLSGKMRMNSIIGMNDRSEPNFISQYLYGKKPISIYDADTVEPLYEANRRYITSFTTLIDDLNMWRLYGDDSAGVCLVFKALDSQPVPFLYPVCYVDDDKESPITKIKLFINKLKEKNVNFTFNSLDKWGNFFKSKSYSYEQEYRLLAMEDTPTNWFVGADNGILTPYIEKNLKSSCRSIDHKQDFPLHLSEVILGSKMRGKEENIYQLYELRRSLKGLSFSVSISEESTYR